MIFNKVASTSTSRGTAKGTAKRLGTLRRTARPLRGTAKRIPPPFDRLRERLSSLKRTARPPRGTAKRIPTLSADLVHTAKAATL